MATYYPNTWIEKPSNQSVDNKQSRKTKSFEEPIYNSREKTKDKKVKLFDYTESKTTNTYDFNKMNYKDPGETSAYANISTNKMANKVLELLRKLRKHPNQKLYLEEIEDDFGKDIKLEVMIADYSDRLTKIGFNVQEYMKQYQHWNSYERMKQLRRRWQEINDPIINYVLLIINGVNKSFTKEQMILVKGKMRDVYCAILYQDAAGYYFKVDEDSYDLLNDRYYEKVPGIFW